MHHFNASSTVLSLVCVFLAAPAHLQGGTPLGTEWSYQGELKQNGSPVNDTCDFQFSLWDEAGSGVPPSGGNQIGSTLVFDAGNAITVSNGLFTVELDFGAGAFAGDGRWLQISVACPSGSAFQPLSPRQPLTAAPYALYALNDTSLPSPWLISGNNIFYDAGRVGIGVQSPADPLDVRTDAGVAIRAESSGSSGRAVQAFVSASNGIGVVGQTIHSSGIGVEGIATATSGNSYGVYGVSHGPDGRAVNAWAGDPSGTNFAVRALTSSANGYAGFFEGGRNYFEGRVGIGAVEPESLLHVKDGDSGVAPNANARMVLERGTTALINILTPDTAPSGIAFGNPTDGDSAGGIYYNSSTPNGLQFRTGGNATRMVVDAAGNVGVGTTAPESKLHVRDGDAGVSPNGNARLVVERNTSTFINLLTPGTVQSGILFGNPTRGSAAGGVVYNSSNTPNGMQFRVNGNSVKMTITADGDVGIGDTAPKADLHVRGTGGLGEVIVTPGTSDSSAQIRMTENASASLGAVMKYNGTANQWQVLGLNTGGETSPHVVVNRDNGRVGIGTTSPTAPLHVSGELRVDGGITVPTTTRTLMLPATSFEHVKDFGDLNIGFVGATDRPILSNDKTLGADRSAGATVTLPQGAVVESLTAWVNDTALGQAMAVYLKREKFGNTSLNADTMASVLASGSGVQQVTDDTIASATIDNAAYMYWVTARFREGAPAGSEELYGVRITYTVTTPLP